VLPSAAAKYASKYPKRPGVFKSNDKIFGGWRAVDKRWFTPNGIMAKIERSVGGPTSG
jgi:ABC-type sulfate transport system substrate-binding protein